MGSRWHALRAARTALSPFARTSACPASLWQQQLTRAFSALPEHTVTSLRLPFSRDGNPRAQHRILPDANV